MLFRSVAFRKAIDAARAEFRASVEKARMTYIDTVLAAKKVRNTAFEKARADFKKAHDTALAALKAAKAANNSNTH